MRLRVVMCARAVEQLVRAGNDAAAFALQLGIGAAKINGAVAGHMHKAQALAEERIGLAAAGGAAVQDFEGVALDKGSLSAWLWSPEECRFHLMSECRSLAGVEPCFGRGGELLHNGRHRLVIFFRHINLRQPKAVTQQQAGALRCAALARHRGCGQALEDLQPIVVRDGLLY